MQRDCSIECVVRHSTNFHFVATCVSAPCALSLCVRAPLSDLDLDRPSEFPYLRPAPHLVDIFRQTAFCNRPEQLVYSPFLVQMLFATAVAGSRTSRLLPTECDEFAISPCWKP